jgi:hypothetical protein
MILVCAATGAEASACKKGIAASGASKKYEILQTGMGMQSARSQLARRLSTGEVPTLIIASGFAGSWRGRMEVGSWVGATEFWKETRIGNEAKFSKISSADLSHAHLTMTDVNCPMVSVERIQKHPATLPKEISTGPLCVDMETAGLAEIAQEMQIPFGVFRMITDTPEQPLPEFVSTFASAIHAREIGHKAKMGKVGLGQVLSDPISVARFLRSGKKWSDWLVLGWKERAEAIASTPV